MILVAFDIVVFGTRSYAVVLEGKEQDPWRDCGCGMRGLQEAVEDAIDDSNLESGPISGSADPGPIPRSSVTTDDFQALQEEMRVMRDIMARMSADLQRLRQGGSRSSLSSFVQFMTAVRLASVRTMNQDHPNYVMYNGPVVTHFHQPNVVRKCSLHCTAYLFTDFLFQFYLLFILMALKYLLYHL